MYFLITSQHRRHAVQGSISTTGIGSYLCLQANPPPHARKAWACIWTAAGFVPAAKSLGLAMHAYTIVAQCSSAEHAQVLSHPRPRPHMSSTSLALTPSGSSHPSLLLGKKLRREQRPQKRKCDTKREIAFLVRCVPAKPSIPYYIHLRSTPNNNDCIHRTRHPPRMIQP
jgi:hypothetical protein